MTPCRLRDRGISLLCGRRPAVSHARDLIREAEARGWVEARGRGKGSHRVWAKPRGPRIVIPATPARPTVLRILTMFEGEEPS